MWWWWWWVNVAEHSFCNSSDFNWKPSISLSASLSIIAGYSATKSLFHLMVTVGWRRSAIRHHLCVRQMTPLVVYYRRTRFRYLRRIKNCKITSDMADDVFVVRKCLRHLRILFDMQQAKLSKAQGQKSARGTEKEL